MTPDAEELRKSIREVAHDISNPLGILRMALYYLESAHPTEEKREHYYKVIGQTLDKIETSLHTLRSLSSEAEPETPPADSRSKE